MTPNADPLADALVELQRRTDAGEDPASAWIAARRGLDDREATAALKALARPRGRLDPETMHPQPRPGCTFVVAVDPATRGWTIREWSSQSAHTACRQGQATRIADQAIVRWPPDLPESGRSKHWRAAADWLEGLRTRAQRALDDAALADTRRQQAQADARPSLSRPKRADRVRRVARHTGPATMSASRISGPPAGLGYAGEWLHDVTVRGRAR